MASKVKVPPMSQAQEQGQGAMANALTEQQRLATETGQTFQTLTPELYRLLGYTPSMEGGGVSALRGTRAGQLSPEAQLYQGWVDRALAAQQGRLPVNPALLTDLQRQEEMLRTRLRSQFGAGYEGTSGGIRTLGDFNMRKNQILEQARRSDLTMAEAGIQGREQSLGMRFQNLLAPTNLRLGAMLPLYGQQTATAGQLFGMGQSQQQMQYQANQQRAQAQNQLTQAAISGGLSVAGAGVGGFAGAAPVAAATSPTPGVTFTPAAGADTYNPMSVNRFFGRGSYFAGGGNT